MARIYINRGFCYICGEPTDHEWQIDNGVYGICQAISCKKEMLEIERDYEEQIRYAAEGDNYDRYR